MAYYQFENDNSEASMTVDSVAQSTMSWLVRVAGLVLLGVGLWAALGVINEAWSIYQNPKSSRVEALARAIDEATHIDLVLAPSQRADAGNDAVRPERASTLRLSYFIAWPIVMLLLLLVGRLAMAAMRTGGELALFDVQIRRFARELMREAVRSGRSGG
ncbi:MAG: hypothetical protein NFCOHLIN_00989 [Gammaproteobacteria bacterium]|nr:hypothetical protein [Gammaproteobacteria bacterium]